MDLQTLSSTVRLSRLLTASERTYWIQRLPTMSAVQLSKLAGILEQAQQIPWNAQMQTYMSIAQKASHALAA